MGERKAGEPRSEQTPEAGSQPEGAVLVGTAETQRTCPYRVSQLCTRELTLGPNQPEAPAGTGGAGPAATGHTHVVLGLGHPASHPLVPAV